MKSAFGEGFDPSYKIAEKKKSSDAALLSLLATRTEIVSLAKQEPLHKNRKRFLVTRTGIVSLAKQEPLHKNRKRFLVTRTGIVSLAKQEPLHKRLRRLVKASIPRTNRAKKEKEQRCYSFSFSGEADD